MAGEIPSKTSPLAQLIRELRESHNYSHGQLARRLRQLGNKPATPEIVQHWESSTQTPSPDETELLAVALEVPVFVFDAALTTPEEASAHSAKGKPAVNVDDMHIGRRLRQIRHWRGQSITAVAGLAGISKGYLSLIETGQRPVTKRSLLEALANALRISPTDLTDKPWERTSDQTEAQANLVGVTAALDAYELGEDPEGPVRDWPEVEADVKRSEEWMHVHADYVGLADLIPKLLGELHALYVRKPELRREVLLGLVQAYKQAVAATKYLGGGGSNGLSMLAAMAGQRCADELETPQWRAITTWYRCFAAGSINRVQQYRRAVAMAEGLMPAMDDPEVVQAYGMLHLSAAMAAAAQSDRDTAITHLDEAGAVADGLEAEVGSFAMMWFGRTNVGIWRASIGLELGDGASVAEAARTVHVETIPSPKRQSDFFADVGRALLAEKSTWEKGLALLLHAEKLAPQKVRNNLFVREAVGDALRTARREAGGRDLRGLAYRLGLAVR
jgi:transcriptional regulator with XRE-family HTH domain